MKKISLALLSFLALSFLILPIRTKALTISQPVIEITANPGETVSKKVILTNEKKESVTFYPSIQSFSSDDKSGNPILKPIDNVDKNDLPSWIKVYSGAVTLAPNESIEEEIVIEVPQNADPGGHYAALLWGNEAANNDQEGNVNIGWKTGHLILLRVSGNVEEKGFITKFDSERAVYNSLPVKFVTEFKNDGNVHFKPVGNITIRNIFGMETDLIAFNQSGGNVLPKSSRSFSDTWIKDFKVQYGNTFFDGLKKEINNFGFGRYTAEAILYFGSNQTQVRETTAFWVFPWRLMIVFLVIIAILFVLIKKYNKAIINKAQRKK